MDLKIIEKIAKATYGSSFPNDHVKREYIEIVGAMFNRADPKDIRKALNNEPSGKFRIKRTWHPDGVTNLHFVKDGKAHRRFTTPGEAENFISAMTSAGCKATYEIVSK